MVLNGDPTQTEIKAVVDRAGGGASSNSKGDGMDGNQGPSGMDHIQGKLAGMQLGPGGVETGGGSGGQHTGHPLEGGAGDPARNRGGGAPGGVTDPKGPSYHTGHGGGGADVSASDLPKSHGSNTYFGGFVPPSMTIDVDGTGSNQMFKKAGVDGPGVGGTGGGPGRSAGGGDGAGVSRRYGVPMGNNSRNPSVAPRGGPGGPVPGGPVGYGGDDRRRNVAGGGGGGRRGGAAGGMNGGMGVGPGRGRVPGVRPGYGEGASPVRGAVDQSPLQVMNVSQYK